MIKFLPLFIGVIMMLSFSSCKKSEDGSSIFGSMTAKVNGTAWSSLTRVTTVQSGNILLTGQPGLATADQSIAITIKGVTLKTYTLSAYTLAGECLVVYYKKAAAVSGSTDYYVSYAASVTLTKYDATSKLISGTFTATLVPTTALSTLGALLDPNFADKITITEGKFENVSFL